MHHKKISTNNITNRSTKIIPFNDTTIITKKMKRKKECIEFAALMSEQDFSIKSKTWMHLQMFPCFPVFRGPKAIPATAGPTASQCNNGLLYAHSKSITALNRFEHQKTVNIAKNLGNRKIGFQK